MPRIQVSQGWQRKPRTMRIQAISSANTWNTWMKGGNDDTSWLYGYDAWTVPLAAHATEVVRD